MKKLKVFKYYYLRRSILYLIILISNLRSYSAVNLDSLKVTYIDSSVIDVKHPDTLQEKKVFADPKLNYDLNIKYEPGIWERFMDWLSELIFGDTNYENVQLTREVIMWAVVAISIIVVIIIFMRSDLSRLVRPESKLTTFNFSEITDDLSTINFDKMIEDAVRNGDLRTGIRWNYLKCLYLLEKGGHLEFQPSKTNIDYQNDLRRSDFLKEFMAISRIYDYVWYGKFTIDQSKYENLKNEFTAFETHLNVQRKQ